MVTVILNPVPSRSIEIPCGADRKMIRLAADIHYDLVVGYDWDVNPN